MGEGRHPGARAEGMMRLHGETAVGLIEELTEQAVTYETLYFELRALVDEAKQRTGVGEDVADLEWVVMLPKLGELAPTD